MYHARRGGSRAGLPGPGPEARAPSRGSTPCTTCWRTLSPSQCSLAVLSTLSGRAAARWAVPSPMLRSTRWCRWGLLRPMGPRPAGPRPDQGRVPRLRPGRGRGRGHQFPFHREMTIPGFRTDPMLRRCGTRPQELAQRDSWPRLYTRPARASAGPPSAAVYERTVRPAGSFRCPTARAIRGLRP